MTDDGRRPWVDQLRQALQREVTPERAALRRAGTAMRRLIDRMIATVAPLPALEEAVAAMEALERRLDEYPAGRIPEGFLEAATSGDPHAFFDNSPVMGYANPLAPPVYVRSEGDRIVGTACYGAAYEGAPGCVHGGMIAAAFDEVLGMAQSLTGAPGMTGTLTVRYRRPTPLHRDVRYEGWVDRVEGRKIFTLGRLLEGEDVTAEADAVFIRVDFTRIADLYDRRTR